VIKTLNIPGAEITQNSEALQCDSHDSVIEFITIFNNIFPEKEQIFKDSQENFNFSYDFSADSLAFHSKIIEIHEELSEKTNEQISNIQLTIDFKQDIPIETEVDENERLECLTLKVSGQPWIFGPKDQDLPKIPSYVNQQLTKDDVVEETPRIIEKTVEPTLKINSDSIDFFNCGYIVQECNVSKFTFEPQATVEKYEALSTAIHSQIKERVLVHNFASSDTLEIELYPQKLGKVKIRCDIENNDKVTVQVSAEKLTTLAILQQNAQELKEIIDRNFRESQSMESQLSFEMSNETNQQENRDRNSSAFKVSKEEEIKTTVHFLHNGIINLSV